MPKPKNKSAATHIGDAILAMQHKQVVVVGDVMLDAFVHGAINRISPEAPVPVLTRQQTRFMPGGAANVARNLAHMGLGISLIGVVGDDEAAARLKTALADEVGITPHLITDGSRPTTQKTRFTTAQQQILRVDVEKTHPVNANATDAVTKALTQAIAGKHQPTAIIFSDYNKGVVSRRLIETGLQHKAKSKTKSLHILADPKQRDPSLFAGVDMLTPNLAELAALCQTEAFADASSASINTAANRLARQHNIAHIITTLSAEGMLVSDGSKTGFHTASQAKSVYDVSGAGDTVIAHLAAALVAGVSVYDAALIANQAAAIVVSKTGTASITPGELLGEVLLADGHATGAMPLATIQQHISDWRARDEAIVFTNGCFDCLHPGHIWLLAEAAKLGDRLIVGINSDASTRRLKGHPRPLQSQAVRASVLAALPMVDGVVVFDEDTPANLIQALTPNVLVKGGDYKAEAVVGGDHVTANGGEVRIIANKAGFSTTRLMAG